MVDESDSEWRERFRTLPRTSLSGDCPDPVERSRWTQGGLGEEALGHLARCSSCREELVEIRRTLADKTGTERVSLALRSKLYALAPRRRRIFAWVGAAAALFMLAIGLALLLSEPSSEVPERPGPPVIQRRPLASAPGPAPVVAPERVPDPPPIGKASSPPPPISQPGAPPEPVIPVPAPPPLSPATPRPPETAPAAPPGAPPAQKAAPPATRPKARGSILALSGSSQVMAEGDPQGMALRAGQTRAFSGSLRIQAESAPSKVRVDANTFFIQRGTELELSLEDSGARLEVFRGDAFFDLAPESGPFQVVTAQGQISAKGSRFMITVGRNDTEVLVQHGQAEISASGASVLVREGERSLAAGGKPPGPAQKADWGKRLVWLRGLEDTLRIEAARMALQGMVVWPDPLALGGRAIGLKEAPKPGLAPSAEIRVKRKQPGPYWVFVRLLWPHHVPSSLTVSVGDRFKWSSKDVPPSSKWQWVQIGSLDPVEETFKVILSDSQPGMRVDQILLTTDPELGLELDKK